MRLNLSKKIILTIQAGVLFGVVLFGFVLFFFVKSNIERQIDVQLASISSLKTSHIKQYLDFHVLEVESSVKSSHIKESLIDLLQGKSKDNGAMVISMLSDGMIDSSDLLDIYVINNDGIIVASNNKEEEGKIKSDEKYFISGKEKTTIQNFSYDLSSKEIITTIATPIKDNAGKSIGVLATKINTAEINKLMINRAGLGETGETFLVNSFNFVTTDLLKEKNTSLKKALYLPQINTCLKGNSSFYHMNDYFGDKVYGYARYLPELDACLISKINESELLKPIEQMIPQMIVFILIIFLVTLIFGYFIGESIIRPLHVLNDQVIKVKNGDMDVLIEPKTDDEVGDMAISFKEMLSRLKELYKNLEDKVKERTEELEKSEKKLGESLDLYEKNNKMMINRELEMIKLKEQIRELEESKKNNE